MDPINYFTSPTNPSQRQYEALKAYYVDGLSTKETSKRYNFKPAYFKKLKFNFLSALKNDQNPFFQIKKPGPKKRSTEPDVIQKIVALRKKNHSITDIKVILEALKKSLSLDTIDSILKDEGFAPLPKRTRMQRLEAAIPEKIEPPQSVPLNIIDEEFSTEKGAGPLIFLPLIEQLGLIKAIQNSDYPETFVLNDISSVLSFLALKLLGNERLSHDATWNLDRALGFFAGLNVLPKKSTLSSYSYRVNRSANRKLLLEMSKIFKDEELENGEFNLDFKTIPHWGDASILEKNWAGSRSKSMKSILSLIVQDPSTGYLSYSDAEIRHRNQKNVVLDFVDFWKEGRGVSPKMLIFDSKFTTYKNLNELNESKDKVKFLTLRRRGKKLIKRVSEIPELNWKKIHIEGKKRKVNTIKVYEEECHIRNYTDKIRQVIIKDHGRKQPSFLITNDFNIKLKDIIKKYARRWLVEQEIAEQIAFFQLNNPSSSIVVKVDFDLTISLLAHNLYRVLSNKLPGFEHCTVSTIYRNFLENGAIIKIKNNTATILLKKKTHLPILFELPWLKEESQLSWLNLSIKFEPGTTL